MRGCCSLILCNDDDVVSLFLQILMNVGLVTVTVMPSATTPRAPSPVSVGRVSMATASAAHRAQVRV